MYRPFLRTGWWLTAATALCSLILWSACSRQSPQNQASNRPWAFRSVLDGTPRALTIVLNPRLSVAYHTESAGLFKAWPGQLDLNGAVYTGAHGPQPTTKGGAFIEDTTMQTPWRLAVDGKDEIPSVQYLGHAFEDSVVVLSYQLTASNGQQVTLTEKPIYNEGAIGPGLTRVFAVADNPAGLSIKLNMAIDAQAPFSKITQSGTWDESLREEVGEGPDGFKVAGVLTLNPTGETKFTVFLAEEMLTEPADTTATLAEQMTALYENSGCYSCHHPQNKAVGPSYAAIAEKYEDNPDNRAYLVGKVIKGGAGNWGETAMIPHPHIAKADIERMVAYMFNPEGEESAEPVIKEPNRGVATAFYQVRSDLTSLPDMAMDQAPFSVQEKGRFRLIVADVLPVANNFYVKSRATLTLEKAQTLPLRANRAYGGIRVKVNGKTVVDQPNYQADYVETPAKVKLPAGDHVIEMEYFGRSLPPYNNVTQTIAEIKWLFPGDGNFHSWALPGKFTYDAQDLAIETEDPISTYSGPNIPGDGVPLVDVHPAFTLSQARPDSFKPRVGGIDFMTDGRMVVSTWDQVGAVYILDNLDQADPEKITVKQIATGLAEPLGLKVVDDQIYVLQKQELTQLIDHNDDLVADEYRTVSNDWIVTSNFHEFMFGLAYRDGHFYANTAIGILPGGKSAPNQSPDRGKTVKINKETGKVDFISKGLRTPNGIGFGTDGELFALDNQGDWLPANKIVHVRPGAFFGNRSVDIEGDRDRQEDPPAVWLPQDEIGNSPGQLVSIDKGPYAGQMIYGEVTHGGIKRTFVEKVNGAYQGVVFRWMQGFDAGVNRLRWSPDGSLYVGQIGVSGNWGHYSEKGFGKYGLQRLTYNGASVFEMLAVRAKSNGLEIEFTEALMEGEGNNPADYQVEQWMYQPTADYGGPKLDEKALEVVAANVSADRKRVFLQLAGMEAGHVVHIQLKNHFISQKYHELWTTEAWYTLNQIPDNQLSTIAPTPYAAPVPNTLTAAEQAAGWKLLFNGENLDGWHKYGNKPVGTSWQIQEGTLALTGAKNAEGKFVDGDDLITDEEYENFELSLEWKIEKGGNSGIFYFIHESDEYSEPYFSAPEMQVLDNARHEDSWIISHRAGDLYDLIVCKYTTVLPAESWNKVRVIARQGKVEHWLNGYKVVTYDMNSPEWPEMIANSKFKEWAGFGTYQKGHIGLQDHDNYVWYRNIKIRTLDPVQ